MSMKKGNSFQKVKVQPQRVASLLLTFFCQFQPGIAYKSVANKKNPVLQTINELKRLMNYSKQLH